MQLPCWKRDRQRVGRRNLPKDLCASVCVKCVVMNVHRLGNNACKITKCDSFWVTILGENDVSGNASASNSMDSPRSGPHENTQRGCKTGTQRPTDNGKGEKKTERIYGQRTKKQNSTT